MKIVCGSCQAKYSIADEKVAGKVFKIRCKRCGEVIVVRGDQDAAAELGHTNGAGGHADESSVDAIWHVVVNGEQAGPYAPAQLADMIRAEQLDWEAYVWCEGFDNWLPMRDVPDLVAAISGQHEEPAQQAAAAPRASATLQGSVAPSMGADPFADDAAGGGGAVGMFAKQAPQSGAQANMYGDVQSSSFDSNPRVPAQAAGPRVTAEQAMTGVRNENSVLFSLKNLQALATGSSTPAAAAGMSNRPGFAGGDGSGLIDIRALATTTGVGDTGRHDNEKDALLSIGSAQAGAFGALGSPMLAPGKSEEEGSKKGLALAMFAGFALLAVAGIAIAMILKPAPQAAAVIAAPQPPIAAAAPPPPSAAIPVEPPSEGEKRALENAPPPAAAVPTAPEARPTEHTAHPGGRKAPVERAAPESEKEPMKAADAKPSKVAPAKSNPSSSIDDLLNNAMGPAKGGAAKTESAAASNLPEKPTREDVLSAMSGVKDAVKACGKGETGTAIANVTVSGKTGRISNAEITGMTGEVGSCIARSVRKATFPKFKADTFQVKFPFRL